MPQDWGPVVYSGSATTNTFPVDDTAICKSAPKPHASSAQVKCVLQVHGQYLSIGHVAPGMGNLAQ